MKAITNTRLPGHAQNGRLFFATLSSVIGLFFAASYLIGCSGLTTSVRSSNTSNPDSLRVTTAGLSVGISQSGDAGGVSGEVLSRFGPDPGRRKRFQASLVARTAGGRAVDACECCSSANQDRSPSGRGGAK